MESAWPPHMPEAEDRMNDLKIRSHTYDLKTRSDWTPGSPTRAGASRTAGGRRKTGAPACRRGPA
eukprot:5328750-Alexandrium_andersonii.AAC.1